MSKLDELIKTLCPDGVEYKALGEIGKVSMCKRIMKAETTTEGDVPFYKIGTFGKEPDAYISYEKYNEYKSKFSYPNKGDILISASGTIGRTVVYNGEPAYYQDSNIVWLAHDESIVLNTYLKYCYELKPWNINNGGTIQRLYNDNINKTRIPVPPLEVQREIVRILDNFTELTAELTVELTCRKKQYEYYLRKVLTPKGNWELRELNEVCEIITKQTGFDYASTIKPSLVTEKKPNTYPFIQNKDFNGLNINLNTDFYIPSEVANMYPKITLDKPSILISISGKIGNVGYYNLAEKAFIGGAVGICKLKDNINGKYIMYYIQSAEGQKYLFKSIKAGSHLNITVEAIRKLPIKFPPIEEQERIVAILDRFDAICNDISIGLPAEIEARTKQYEYYRDKLLTFKEKVA